MNSFYNRLCSLLTSLTDGIKYDITNFSNASALLMSELSDINWAGFYFIIDGKLRLGPFQGKPACTSIEIGKGVCGSAAAEEKTLVVNNVHEFKGHIACDSASNSEIVVPLKKNGAVFGVLDIDSPVFSRFNDEDKLGLEEFAKILERASK
ncbi:MAG: GAF domain-containing protein [Oscillospiraceae bacterium]|nr:GAF domain-containing protein [Oscillospiraceae bacterium]